ncbi:hypothetical protein LSH36_40g15062, partial [Paralvinella palmiformis]
FQELSIPKAPGDKLGISIRGGVRSHPGNPLDNTDEGIFISKILSHGIVAKDGHLHVGHRILEVNGQSLLGATHDEAVKILRSVNDRLEIMVCDGFEPSLIDMTSSMTSLKGRQDSVSSVDRLDEEAIYIFKKEAETLQEQKQFEEEEKQRLARLRLTLMRDDDIQFADEDTEDEEVVVMGGFTSSSPSSPLHPKPPPGGVPLPILSSNPPQVVLTRAPQVSSNMASGT